VAASGAKSSQAESQNNEPGFLFLTPVNAFYKYSSQVIPVIHQSII
jgi:hypothetical protein